MNERMEGIWIEQEAAHAQQMLSCSFIGGPGTVQKGLQGFLNETKVDEVIATAHIYNQDERLYSYQLLKELFDHIV